MSTKKKISKKVVRSRGRTISDKQKKFCSEYVIDWNAARAARAAGYSESAARQEGYRLLTKDYIKAYIKELQKDLQKIAGVSKLRVLNKYIEIAFETKNTDDVKLYDKIKALENICKMLGYNEAEKHDIDVTTQKFVINGQEIVF